MNLRAGYSVVKETPNILIVQPNVLIMQVEGKFTEEITIERQVHYDLLKLENIARTCYQSFDKNIRNENAYSYERLLRHIIKQGHLSILEHQYFTFKFITNRSMLAQLTRYRHASYAAESQDYCDYKGKVVLIYNPLLGVSDSTITAYEYMALKYKEARANEVQKQYARGFLNNDVKVEICMTVNARSLRHIYEERVLGNHLNEPFASLIIKAVHVLLKNYSLLFEDLIQKYEDMHNEKVI